MGHIADYARVGGRSARGHIVTGEEYSRRTKRLADGADNSEERLPQDPTQQAASTFEEHVQAFMQDTTLSRSVAEALVKHMYPDLYGQVRPNDKSPTQVPSGPTDPSPGRTSRLREPAVYGRELFVTARLEDQAGKPSTRADARMLTAIEAARQANPTLAYADAVQVAARQHPDLSRAFRAEALDTSHRLTRCSDGSFQVVDASHDWSLTT